VTGGCPFSRLEEWNPRSRRRVTIGVTEVAEKECARRSCQGVSGNSKPCVRIDRLVAVIGVRASTGFGFCAFRRTFMSSRGEVEICQPEQ
jgi:hypothetical protein